MKDQKFQLVKKAFVVYHKGMLDENPHEGYTIDSIPVTYAETANKAKRKAHLPFDYELEGKAPMYIDLKVRRAKGGDKVMFDGKEMCRHEAIHLIKERARIEQRKLKVERYPDNAKFYISKGYVGNCLLFWGLNSSGYVCNITEAQAYSKEEVLKRFVPGSAENKIWEASHVLANIKPVVDSQYLNSAFVS